MASQNDAAFEFEPAIQDYGVITDEKAAFLHDHSKEYLLHTINTYEGLQNKVTLLLGFIFPSNILLFISFNTIEFTPTYLVDRVVPLILISNIIIAFYLLYGFLSLKIAHSGNEPRNLLQQEFLNQELRFIKISEVIHYQNMIDINIKTIIKVESVLRWSVVGLVVLPVLSYICIYFIFPRLSNF